jgi:SAM-dependent methyltransferase
MMVCPDVAHAATPTVAPYSTGETDFRQCTACGLLFRERFPSARELNAIYELAYREEVISLGATNQESGLYATRAYARFILGRFLEDGMSALDFGAGTGALVKQLKEAGLYAEGFEFAEAARVHALKELQLNLMGDVEAIPRAKYEFVSMIEVIEHLTDLPGTLARLYAAIKPGGMLFVTTPNRLGWRARLEAGRWREARKKFHLFLFDERSLRHHLGLAGFKVITKVRWAPVLKPGVLPKVIVRCTQLADFAGSLCFVARRL